MTAAAPSLAPSAPGTRPGPKRAWRRRPPLFLLIPGAAAALLALAPIGYLIQQATQRGWSNVVDELWQRRTFDLLVRSLALGGAVTVACIAIGVIGAWLVVRTDLPGRGIWQVVLALPLAVPSYVAAYAWVSWRPSLAGFWGATLVLTLTSFPYVFLPVLAALRRLDPAQEDVARALGHGTLSVSLGLTLRQVRPAIAAGGLLVALYVLSDFGAVGAMRYEVFTWVIYSAYRAGFNPARAAILALALAAVSLVIVAFEAKVRGSAAYSRLGSGTPRPQTPIRLGRWRWAALAFVGAVAGLALAFPAVRLVYWVQRAVSVQVPLDELAVALRNTLGLAALAAIVTIVLAIPVGVLAARFRSPGVTAIERSTYVAHALPGIVIALSLVFMGIRWLRPFYQEVPLLVLAYVVLFLPLAVGSVRSSVEQSPRRLEEVAHSLGLRARWVLARVSLPLASPGLAAGACLVFLTVMKELPATLLLRPTGTETLATRLWTFTAENDYAAGAPYAAALVLFASAPAAFLARYAGQRAMEGADLDGS